MDKKEDEEKRRSLSGRIEFKKITVERLNLLFEYISFFYERIHSNTKMLSIDAF